MILMIDNYDSFTYNVVQYCYELGANLKVVRNDKITVEEIEELNPQKIIISPGPATPDEAGISLSLIRYFKNKKPILGICLGHQAIAQAFGGRIVEAKQMKHGKVSPIEIIKNNEIFKDIPAVFNATRYHSLVVEKGSLSPNIEINAYSKDDKEIMAIKVRDKPIFGVQFHPESIMSEYGHKLLDNFLKL
jgi:anthranilate synthase component 2